MTGFLQSLVDDYREQAERYRNRPFLRAAMAACALAAAAGGEVTFSQRIRVDQILDTLERLKVFDPHDGVDLFNHYAAAILESPGDGQAQALDEVRPFAEDPETAGLLVRICLAVAEAGGDMSVGQDAQVRALCARLELEPERVALSPRGRDGQPRAADARP